MKASQASKVCHLEIMRRPIHKSMGPNFSTGGWSRSEEAHSKSLYKKVLLFKLFHF